jgi:hypothetical protein
MNLADVMDEIAEAMTQIAGLTVHAYPIASLTAPAGYLSYPVSIDYDEAYQRGEDQFTDLPIVLVAGKSNDKAARNKVAKWAAGAGLDSIKGALEGRSWNTFDDITVTSVEFDAELIGSVPYLAAMFKATVVGSGED